jgi:hypothetical protein
MDFNHPTVLYSDNQGAIALARNNKFHARLKHINIHYHFICEAVATNQSDLCTDCQKHCRCVYKTALSAKIHLLP